MSYDKKTVKNILDDPELGKTIFGASGYYRIMPYPNDIILFLGEEGELLTNHLPYKFVEKGVRGVHYSDSDERVLVWQKDAIGVLDFSTEATEKVAFEKGPRLTWVFTAGKNVEEASWVYKGSHAIFTDDNAVFLLDLGSFAPDSPVHLFDGKNGTSLFYSEKEGSLYYLEPVHGNFVSVKIVYAKEEEEKKSK